MFGRVVVWVESQILLRSDDLLIAVMKGYIQVVVMSQDLLTGIASRRWYIQEPFYSDIQATAS